MDDPTLTCWLASVRAVHFACCLLIAGVWVFDRLVMPRALAAWRRPAVLLLTVATLLAGLSGTAWFVLVAADMSGQPVAAVIHDQATLRLVWSQTRFGRTWQIHGLFWIAGAVAASVHYISRPAAGKDVITGNTRVIPVCDDARHGPDARPAKSFGGEPAALTGMIYALGLVAGLAWAGHGDTGPAPVCHLTADVIHLIASTVWPAGLVPFLLVLVRVGRSGVPDRWDVLHTITRRFSAASLTAVALLVLTGVVNSWCLLGSFGALFSTAYGRVLAVKLGLFAILFGIGGFNLLRLKPRVPTGSSVVRRLRTNVTIEIVLGAVVVAVVGLLGILEPARQ